MAFHGPCITGEGGKARTGQRAQKAADHDLLDFLQRRIVGHHAQEEVEH